MVKKYATCNIEITPTLTAKPTRKRNAEINIEMKARMKAGPSMQPIKLVIKGENYKRVLRLLALYGKTDEEINALVDQKKLLLGSEVKDKKPEEIAAWVRGGVLSELRDLAGEDGE